MPKQRKLKTGVKSGGGPPPGYEWSVGVLDNAFEEAAALLNTVQYRHMAMQVKELARQADPKHSRVVDVRPVEQFLEIRDKGGPLGNLNVRVFYGVDDQFRTLIVLGAIIKKNDGRTPLGDVIRIRRRWRNYCEGSYGRLER